MPGDNKRRRLNDATAQKIQTAEPATSRLFHAFRAVIESSLGAGLELGQVAEVAIWALLNAGVSPMVISGMVQKSSEPAHHALLKLHESREMQDVYKQVDNPNTHLGFKEMQESARARTRLEELLSEKEKLLLSIKEINTHNALLVDQKGSLQNDVNALRGLLCNARDT